ncbi:MAG TPA: amino acid-binding protein [Alphaproteobacteria bacterium]|nr:amino acid-binding protein [Alphaproteobacteria bacterium]
MASIALISIFCPDRVGLVSAIADHLFSAGINLRDTSFAALGSGAEFTSVCELPAELAVGALEEGLRELPELRGAEIRVVPFAFDPHPGPMGRITHRVEISGGDQLGLIARLSEIFTQYGANIVRLEAQKIPEAAGDRYVTRFAVWIPADRAETCLAAIDNTAGSLGLASRAVPSKD